jgi:hypothetical protein
MMNNLKRVTIALATLGIGMALGATITTAKLNQPAQTSTDYSATATVADPIAVTPTTAAHVLRSAQLTQLQHTIEQLQRENQDLRQQSASPPSSTNPVKNQECTDAAVAQAASALKLEALQTQQLMRTAERFNNWLTNAQQTTPDFNLNQEMQTQFDAEAIDSHWAETQEQEYLSLFSESTELSGLALRDAQCRTQQCAITIGITNIEQANQLVEQISKALLKRKKYPMIIAAPDEQQGTTKLYIGKYDSSFEIN